MALRFAGIILAAAAIAAGCGKSPPPLDPQYKHPSPVAQVPDLSFERESAPPPAPPESDDSTALVTYDTPMVDVVDPAEYVANWKKTLNSMIDAFVQEQGRPPKNLNELVEQGMLEALPQAPGGGRFDLEPRYNHVVVITK